MQQLYVTIRCIVLHKVRTGGVFRRHFGVIVILFKFVHLKQPYCLTIHPEP